MLRMTIDNWCLTVDCYIRSDVVVEKKAAAYLYADWWISRRRNSRSGEEIPIEIVEFFSFSRQTTMVQPIAGPGNWSSELGHKGYTQGTQSILTLSGLDVLQCQLSSMKTSLIDVNGTPTLKRLEPNSCVGR